MPNVPNVPGVPALSSYAENAIELLTADAPNVIDAFFAPPQWGIYQNGVPVLSYDTQVGFSYKQDWSISTYPVEQGAFQSYDKVQLPAEIRIRIAAGGSLINRQEMLQSIDAVMSTTSTYDIVTPEETYQNFNFSHRDYDRTAENVGLIVVDLWFVEIIETATAQYQNTSTPVVAGQQGLGNASTAPPTLAIQSGLQQQGLM